MKLTAADVRTALGEAGVAPRLTWRNASGNYGLLTLPQAGEIDFDALTAQRGASSSSAPMGEAAIVIGLAELERANLADLVTFDAIGVPGPANLAADQAAMLRRVTRALFDLGHVAVWPAQSGNDQFRIFVRSSLPRGFVRSAPGQARITMRSLGQNGRFANQLFQYAFLKLYSLRHSADLRLPDWDGKSLFGHDDLPLGDSRLAELRYGAFDDDDRFLWGLDEPPVEVDFWGYFHELPAVWAPHRQLLRTLFSPRGATGDQVAPGLRSLRGMLNRRIVAIHVRRGDYRDLEGEIPWYRLVPVAWYADWLRPRLTGVVPPVLYVASDEPDAVLDALKEFKPKSFRDTGLPPELASLFDFEVLRRADQIAVSNSSFSRMAAILADDRQEASIADFSTRRFVAYDAWRDTNFWARFAPSAGGNPMFGSGMAAVQSRGLALRQAIGRLKLDLEAGANAQSGRPETDANGGGDR